MFHCEILESKFFWKAVTKQKWLETLVYIVLWSVGSVAQKILLKVFEN